MGFTVSVLIASIALDGRQLEEAKIGVLAAALVAPFLAWVVFQVTRRLPAEVRARQIAGTYDDLLDLSEDVDPERDHIRGPDDAPVTLVEYGDYECPYCGRAEPVVRELLDTFGDDLRYVWRHLPLNDVHPNAQNAAEAAEAAAAQGAFWEMHDKLIHHQDQLGAPDPERHAEELGLDVERFRDEMRRRVYAPRVAEDVSSADESGVAGTPGFFINGRRHRGAYDVETLSNLVRAARSRARAQQAAARRLRARAGRLTPPATRYPLWTNYRNWIVPMTFLLIPLDEAIVFPGVTATLPIDTGEEDRVFLLPRQNGEFGRIGVVAEVIERAQLPNGEWAATVVGLHRGLAGAAESSEADELRVEVQEIHDGNPEDERSRELSRVPRRGRGDPRAARRGRAHRRLPALHRGAGSAGRHDRVQPGSHS